MPSPSLVLRWDNWGTGMWHNILQAAVLVEAELGFGTPDSDPALYDNFHLHQSLGRGLPTNGLPHRAAMCTVIKCCHCHKQQQRLPSQLPPTSIPGPHRPSDGLGQAQQGPHQSGASSLAQALAFLLHHPSSLHLAESGSTASANPVSFLHSWEVSLRAKLVSLLVQTANSVLQCVCQS